MGTFLLTVLMLVGLFLMFVILLQRGRGGGLAGAFGGLGGQSAFGTKAGDVFTVITIVTVCLWVVVACLAGWRLRVEDHDLYMLNRPEETADAKEDADADSKKSEEKPGDEAEPEKKQPVEKSDAKPADDAATESKQPPADGAAKSSETKPESKPAAPDENKTPPQSDKPEAGESKQPD